MKTIIVATDFSPASTCAMNYAADMAIQLKAALLLFHVYQVPIAVSDTPLVMVSVDELREGAEQQLSETKAALEHITAPHLSISTACKLGDPVDELQNICEEIQPFVVIMGTRGHSGLETTLFGSTTLSAIRQLKWPVLAVPIGKEYGTGIKKIGLASDFREVADTIPVPVIRSFVKDFNAELHVLNVDYDNRQQNDQTSEQAALLNTLLDGLDPQYHFIKHKDIEDGINEFAETNNIDIIISIPKKHKLMESLFRKSSTRQLVFDSRVPVLCAH